MPLKYSALIFRSFALRFENEKTPRETRVSAGNPERRKRTGEAVQTAVDAASIVTPVNYSH